MSYRRTNRKGFTLVEVGVAVFIVTLVAMAGFAYYGTARVTEINAWHDQNALFLCEREIEAWHANGYSGMVGFEPTDSTFISSPTSIVPTTLTYLPYGYRHGSPSADWSGGSKDVTFDGFTYRVRAANLHTANTGNDCYVEQTTAGVTYRYRRLVVEVQWGSLTPTTSTWRMRQETRMAR